MGASDRMGRRSLSLRHVTDCMIVLIVLKAWAQTPEAQNTMMCHVRGEQGVGQRGWDGRDALARGAAQQPVLRAGPRFIRHKHTGFALCGRRESVFKGMNDIMRFKHSTLTQGHTRVET